MPSASAAPGTGTAPAYSLMTRHAVQKFPVRGRSRDRPGRHVCELPESRRVARAAAAALARGGHDELLFIVIHQVYELWFKELLHELDRVRQWLEDDEPHRAQHTLKRILSILKVMVAQLDILETMTPLEFRTFRERLEARAVFSPTSSARSSSCSASSRRPRFAASGRKPRAGRAGAALSSRRCGTRSCTTCRAKATWCRHRISNATGPADRTIGGRAADSSRGIPGGPEERGAVRAAGRPRRRGPGVALPAREDGGADDRREAWDERFLRCGLPAGNRRAAALPGPLGNPVAAVGRGLNAARCQPTARSG